MGVVLYDYIIDYGYYFIGFMYSSKLVSDGDGDFI